MPWHMQSTLAHVHQMQLNEGRGQPRVLKKQGLSLCVVREKNIASALIYRNIKPWHVAHWLHILSESSKKGGKKTWSPSCSLEIAQGTTRQQHHTDNSTLGKYGLPHTNLSCIHFWLPSDCKIWGWGKLFLQFKLPFLPSLGWLQQSGNINDDDWKGWDLAIPMVSLRVKLKSHSVWFCGQREDLFTKSDFILRVGHFKWNHLMHAGAVVFLSLNLICLLSSVWVVFFLGWYY